MSMPWNIENFDQKRYRDQVREQIVELPTEKCVAIAARAAWRAMPMMFEAWDNQAIFMEWWQNYGLKIAARLAWAAAYEQHSNALVRRAAASLVDSSAAASSNLADSDAAAAVATAAYAASYAAYATPYTHFNTASAVSSSVSAYLYHGDTESVAMVMSALEADITSAKMHSDVLTNMPLWPELTPPEWLEKWSLAARELMTSTPNAEMLHTWLAQWVRGEPLIDEMRVWFNDWWLKHPDNKEQTPAYSDMSSTLSTEPQVLPIVLRKRPRPKKTHEEQEIPADVSAPIEPPAALEPPDEINIRRHLESTVALASDREAKQLTPTAEKCKEALARFLASAETQTPLTVSVEAPWGAGKTSFMSHLRKRLEAEMIPTVWFNPWKHEAGKTMWAAFAVEYERQMGAKCGRLGKLRRRVGLSWQRLSGTERLLLAARLGLWLLGIGALLWLLCQGMKLEPSPDGKAAPPITDLLAQKLPLLGVPLLLWGLLKDLVSSLGSPLKVDVAGIFTHNHHEEGVDDLHRFHEDFARLMRVYHPANGWWVRLLRWWDELYDSMDDHWKKHWHALRNLALGRGDDPMPEPPRRYEMRRVVVFIDDLDRCEAPKAADVLQSLHLMLNVTESCLTDATAESETPEMICVLGMDREKVAAAVAAKHEKLLPLLLDADEKTGNVSRGLAMGFGHEFLEKFIQLTLHLPGMVGEDRAQYLKGITGWKQKPVSMAAGWEITGYEKAEGSIVRSTSGGDISPKPGPETLQPSVSPADVPQTIEQAEVKARVRNVDEHLHDGQTAFDCASYVADALENNPRRLKQFVNLLRLRLLLAAAMDLLDADTLSADVLVVKEGKLSAHQLAKLVALDLMCPQSMAKMRGNPGIWYSTLTDLAKAENAERSDAITVMLNHGRRLNPDPLRNLYVLDGAPLEAYFQQLATVAPAPMTGPVNAEDIIEDQELAERRGRAGLK